MPAKHEPLGTPTDLGASATRDISAALTGLLADVFALYVKTKNFHYAERSALPRLSSAARRARRSDLCHDDDRQAGSWNRWHDASLDRADARQQQIPRQHEPYVTPQDMLSELRGATTSHSICARPTACDESP
jgi:starvation-inducible DNA-binding protein